MKTAYWANHPLSIQRATRIACLVLGSDETVFAALPSLVSMPEFRAEWCEDEYLLAEAARVWVTETYATTGQVNKDNEGGSFSYATPQQSSHETLVAIMSKERMLEQAVEFVDAMFVRPGALSINARSCGSPNAYWDGDAREIVLCFELMETFYDLSAEQDVQALEKRLREINAGEN